MNGSEGYDLKWKNHLRDVFDVVRALRTKEAFSDVIVHCGGRNFYAHKVILAASSTFFERMLAGIPTQKSEVLVLTDVRVNVFQLLLDFIYAGQVFIDANALEDFMVTAEKLGIRGLGKSSDEAEADEPPSIASPLRTGDDVKLPASTSAVIAARTTTSVRSRRQDIDGLSSASDRDGPLTKKARMAATAPARPMNIRTRPIAKFSCEKPERGEAYSPLRTLLANGAPGEPSVSVPAKIENLVIPAEQVVSIIKEEEEECDLSQSNDGADWKQWGEEAADGEEPCEEMQYASGGLQPLGDYPDQPDQIPPEILSEGWEPWTACGPGAFRGIHVPTGNPVFFCGHCGYRNRNTSNMRKHIWTHTGFKPFPCLLCATSFRQKNHLSEHMKRRHGVLDRNASAVKEEVFIM